PHVVTLTLHHYYFPPYLHSSVFTLFFFFYCYGDHQDLHSFPTRRSSDLTVSITASRRASNAAAFVKWSPSNARSPATPAGSRVCAASSRRAAPAAGPWSGTRSTVCTR